MNATSQKALIMSEAEMRAFEKLWSYTNRYKLPVSVVDSMSDLYNRVTEELKRESGSTL